MEGYSLVHGTPIIKRLLREKSQLTTIYKVLRGQPRFTSFGDYPICALIVRLAVENGHKIDADDIVKLLKNSDDGEFKRVQSNSDLVKHLLSFRLLHSSRFVN